MRPTGLLMIEHRLIERIIPLIKQELLRLNKTNQVNAFFVANTIYFMRAYADRAHHGKEEDILFRELARKNLRGEHKTIMNELIEEHREGRKLVTGLAASLSGYQEGDLKRGSDVYYYLSELTKFYPAHLEKEDRLFFYPIHQYFSPSEMDAILLECYEFDRKMLHQSFIQLVSDMESAGGL